MVVLNSMGRKPLDPSVVKPWCSVKVERQVYGWFVGWCKKHGVLRQAQATKVLREWLEQKREEEQGTDNV